MYIRKRSVCIGAANYNERSVALEYYLSQCQEKCTLLEM